jgi:hypothetical protein
VARLARIFSNGEYHEVPPIFTMELPEATLVFECRREEATAEYADEYAVYRLAAGAARGVAFDELTHGLDPVGTIPVSDVAFDESRGFTLRTMGLERFAEAR